MQFRDPERQERFEKMNTEGLSLTSLIASFNASKLMFLELLAAGPQGDDPMKWTERVVAMEAQLSRAGDSLLKTSEKLNHVLNKESLHWLSQKLVEICTRILSEHVEPRVHERVADQMATELSQAIQEARNNV